MIYFPEWSDLGSVSTSTRSAWEGELVIRDRHRRYFDGLVFKEKVEAENLADAPLLYPLGLNLVKMMCLAQTDALFGEWEDQCVQFEARQDETSGKDHEAAIQLLSQVLANSNANSMLWELGLDRNIYGGGVLKVTPSLQPGFVKWSRIPLENFFPIWDPDDPDTLLEVWVVVEMTAEQARAKYGMNSTAEIVTRIEHWTPFIYENFIEGRKIDAFSGVNPWGFVPFVYIPNSRSNHFWGLSLTEDIIPVQDELNAVLADVGEAINYNSHPIRYGINLPRAFNTRNFPLDPNALWDLGRQMPGADEPKVGLLEAQHAVRPEVFNYVKFLYDWTRVSAFTPPIAFGEDDGGGQRSGATLEIRMMPLIKSNRRSRAYMGTGLVKAMRMTGAILRQKKLSDVPVRAVERLLDGSIHPRFAPVLPQDHQALVDEVVKLMSTEPKSISLETAEKKLGHGQGEVQRIKDDLKDEELKDEEPKSSDVTEAVKGKMTPQSKNPNKAD